MQLFYNQNSWQRQISVYWQRSSGYPGRVPKVHVINSVLHNDHSRLNSSWGAFIHVMQFLHLQNFAMTYFVLVWINVILIQACLLNTAQIQWCNCTLHEQLKEKHSSDSWPAPDSATASRGGSTWPLFWQLNATAMHWNGENYLGALRTVIKRYQASLFSTVSALPKFMFPVYAF